MAEVVLASGHVVLIDDEDLPLLVGRKWYADKREYLTYVRGQVPGQENRGRVRLHNLILGQAGVDHWNGNGLDNRRSNLRSASQSQNMCNTKRRSDSNKRFRGVFYDKCCQKWWVQIAKDHRRHHGGRYDNEEEAALAYNRLAIEHHGEFARLNEVPSP